jgi:hypothetical protein
LRYSLDRARILLDVLIKREKYKRLICKADIEYFSSRFTKTVDKAKGRKSKVTFDDNNNELLEEIISDNNSGEFEEYESDDENIFNLNNVGMNDEIFSTSRYSSSIKDENGNTTSNSASQKPIVSVIKDEFVPISKIKPLFAVEPVNVKSSNDDEVFVSSMWLNKNKEVKIPKKILVAFAGEELSKKEVLIDGGNRAFSKKIKDVLQKTLELSRPTCEIFVSEKEAIAFNKNLNINLPKHLSMDNDGFEKEMKDKHDINVNFGVDEEKELEKIIAKKLEEENKLIEEKIKINKNNNPIIEGGAISIIRSKSTINNIENNVIDNLEVSIETKTSAEVFELNKISNNNDTNAAVIDEKRVVTKTRRYVETSTTTLKSSNEKKITDVGNKNMIGIDNTTIANQSNKKTKIKSNDSKNIEKITSSALRAEEETIIAPVVRNKII